MNEIRLGVYNPQKGGFGVHVVSISGAVLDYEYNGQRIFRNLLKVADNVDKAFTTSERLKHTATLQAAQDYIERFYLRPVEEQITIITGKSLKARPIGKDYVIANVQYFKVLRGGKLLATTYNLAELKNIKAMYMGVEIVPSVCKQMKFEKADYEANKHILKEKAVTPKARSKRDIWAGTFTKFQPTISNRKYNPTNGVLITL